MPEPIFLTIDGEAAQAVQRIMSQTGRTAEESINFAVSLLDMFLGMVPGESMVISKRVGETDLTISTILSESSGDADGG